MHNLGLGAKFPRAAFSSPNLMATPTLGRAGTHYGGHFKSSNRVLVKLQRIG